jgi:hypothetical protein
MGKLQNNPSIGWVHPKSTHAHPLAWANKNTKRNILLFSSYFVRNERKTSSIEQFFSLC